jgi:hypothetical protein
VNILLFHTLTRYVGAWNRCFMSANTSPKCKLLLILEQSQTWSNARDSRQHKCRPIFTLTKQINEAIPCGPYSPHGACCGIFSPCRGRLKDGTSHPCLSYLASSLKSIRENMILWFLNIRHSSTLSSVCGSSPQLNKCTFSSYPLKVEYVELMGKGKGYNSCHVYCQAKW